MPRPPIPPGQLKQVEERVPRGLGLGKPADRLAHIRNDIRDLRELVLSVTRLLEKTDQDLEALEARVEALENP